MVVLPTVPPVPVSPLPWMPSLCRTLVAVSAAVAAADSVEFAAEVLAAVAEFAAGWR